MAKIPLPSIDELRQLLRYEPETGKLFWLVRTPEMFQAGNSSKDARCRSWNTRHAGKEAFGYVDGPSGKRGSLRGKLMQAHRVIWAMANNEWPKYEIDHINGDPTDNRIKNLGHYPLRTSIPLVQS